MTARGGVPRLRRFDHFVLCPFLALMRGGSNVIPDLCQ